jgi:uroporphyrinogen III methyltransferase/synthase
LLEVVPPTCERIDVGKIPGQTKVSQEEICRLLIQKAQQGLRVVRLKGGDPVVFGRVGEEAEALAQANIPFEIIPGITAASGAAAVAKIPLTHRGIASAVTLVTVHEDPNKGNTSLNWNALAQSGTLAFYMAGGRTREVADQLLQSGLSTQTPVVLVQNATLPNERIIRGNLDDVIKGSLNETPGGPFVLIVGEVAGFGRISPPLHTGEEAGGEVLKGMTVVVTHPLSHEPDIFISRLKNLGFQVLHCPAIEIAPADDPQPLLKALHRLGEYDWILFTSKNAVDVVMNHFQENRRDARHFGKCRIGVVGTATADRLREYSIYPDLIPAEATGKGLAQVLINYGEVAGKRFLFPSSEIAREELPTLLTQAGGTVTRITAYRTIAYRGEWEVPLLSLPLEETASSPYPKGEVKKMVVCFASPSAVTFFKQKIGEEDFNQLAATSPFISIGPTTTAALNNVGVENIKQAKVSSYEGMVEVVVEIGFGQSSEVIS